jgi:DNA-directed RNA polymerase subunit M/transcription elongation factor TFIIS
MSDGFFDGPSAASAEGPSAGILSAQKEISDLKKQEETLFVEVGRQAFAANPDGYAQSDELKRIQSNIRDSEEKLEALQREAEEAQRAAEEARRAKEEADAATRCPSCGSQNPEGTKFCQECGTKLGAPAEEAGSATRCPSCGNQNPEGTKFCQECGTKLGAPAQAFCSTCGTELQAGARFCVSCGAQQ